MSRLFRIIVLLLLIVGLWGVARVQDRSQTLSDKLTYSMSKLTRKVDTHECRLTALLKRTILTQVDIDALVIPTKLVISESLFESIVTVHSGEEEWGSGFAISANKFMTARHCVNREGALKIRAVCGEEFDVIAVEECPNRDLAIVTIESSMFIPVKLNLFGNFNPGDSVFTVGSPRAKMQFNIVTSGIIAGIDRSYITPKVPGWQDIFIVDMTLWYGNSGSAIFNMDNEVIGVFVGSPYMPVINYCIPLYMASEWINKELSNASATR